MKTRITSKQVKTIYNKRFLLGYCECQEVLSILSPDYYNAGIYGWNYDVYSFGTIAIVTGYRCTGVGGIKITDEKKKEINDIRKFIAESTMSYTACQDYVRERIYEILTA